jgi:hypothetical protein
MGFNNVEERLSLAVGAEFKHLLDDIVTKNVFHEFMGGGLKCELALGVSNFFKKHLILFLLGLFKSLLDET